MATTKRKYTANGSTVIFDHTIDHLHENDIDVWLIDATSGYGSGQAVLQIKDQNGGTLGGSHPQVTNTRVPTLANSVEQRGWEYTSATRVTLKSAPPNGSTVIIQRNTGRGGDDNAYQAFAAGSTIRANDLNTALNEVRFRAEEGINGSYGGSAGNEANTPYLDASLLKGTSAAIDGNAITNLNAANLSGTLGAASGTNLTNLNAAQLTSGTVPDARFPSTLPAASGANLTSLPAANLTGDIAAARLPDSSTSAKGVVQLSDATNSTSTSLAATANAVKETKTVADAALPKAGGTMTGAIAMGTSKITGLGDPGADQDAATRKYVTDNHYNKTDADDRYYKRGSADDIEAAGVPWSGNDSTVATTAAIDKRIIDLVEEVGGFVPIESENHFPNENPDINNPATGGTIVSIAELSENIVTGSGVTSNNNIAQTIGGTAVTINGLTQNTTYAAGFGMLVETTSTLNTYDFHRLSPKATEVTVVAGKATEITTCHTKATEITTVAGIDTEVTAVAGKATEIGRLGTTDAVADMALLGTTDCVADMAILGTSDVVADLNTLATSDIVSDLDTVATNITDVSNFADLYQIATSAPGTDGGGNSLAAGDLWFDSSSNKQLKVHTGTAFAAVSPTQAVLDDIAIVSGDLTRQEDLGNISDALASATTTSDLETCADNITNINTFANVYRIASSAPSSSLDEGDLWYDSTANVLKYYNGSAWTVTSGAGIADVAADTTPELGGHLDCNNKNLTEVATVSGDNLQIDFGSIA